MGRGLLGMPNIDMLNIIHINFNTIDIQEADIANNSSTTHSHPPGFKT